MDKVALKGRAFSGKSTLAQELVRRGYFDIQFSDSLKRVAISMLEPYFPELTLEEVKATKKYYRHFLIELGHLIGFDWDPAFVNIALQPWWQEGAPSRAVFDNVRFDAQFEALLPYGFELVEVVAPEDVRWSRAKQAGMTKREFNKLLKDPTEGAVTLPGLELDGTAPVEELAAWVECLSKQEGAA
jgi:hypothetical protein